MMSIRLSITSALLGGAALLCSQENPPAPPKTGSVAGTVIDEKSGEGIPKALITLRRDPEGGVDFGMSAWNLDSGHLALLEERVFVDCPPNLRLRTGRRILFKIAT